jgi:hypothetical protein
MIGWPTVAVLWRLEQVPAGVRHAPRTYTMLSSEPLSMRTEGRMFMAKTFSMDTGVAPSSLLARARRAASENGASLVGDEGSGRFSHEMVGGEYRMVGQTVTVTITAKHWLLPWPVVEAQLRELVR